MDDLGISHVCLQRNRFLSSPPCPGQFWSPVSCPSDRGILWGRWSGQRVKLTARLCILLNMSNCTSISHTRLGGAVLYLRQGTALVLPCTFSISPSSPRDIPLNKHHCCLPDLSFTAIDEALLVFSKQTHPNTLQRFEKRPCLRSVFVNLPHHCDSNSSKRFLCVLSYTHRTPPPQSYAIMSVIDLAAWLLYVSPHGKEHCHAPSRRFSSRSRWYLPLHPLITIFFLI